MADLSVSASEVIASPLAKRTYGFAGEAIDAGEGVYLGADGYWYLGQHDGTATESGANTRAGLAVTSAAEDQPVVICEGGDVALGATASPVEGQVYCLSNTPGKLAPYADLGSGDRVTIVGVGRSGNTLSVLPHASGAVKP